jgi:hypothetical protein
MYRFYKNPNFLFPQFFSEFFNRIRRNPMLEETQQAIQLISQLKIDLERHLKILDEVEDGIYSDKEELNRTYLFLLYAVDAAEESAADMVKLIKIIDIKLEKHRNKE